MAFEWRLYPSAGGLVIRWGMAYFIWMAIVPSSTPTPSALRDAECWIFDLDNTLYPAECALFTQIEGRMGEYVARLLSLPLADAKIRQKAFFQKHGTTLRGLMVEHGVDPADYLAYVHDIDLTALPVLPELDRQLARLPGRKLIFTNGTVAHADRVLRRLGLADHFDVIFDIVASDFLPKPNMAPYEKLLREHGVNALGAVMVEDMARNLAPAAALGMATVWVPTASVWSQPDSGHTGYISHVAPDLTRFLAEVTGCSPEAGG